MDEPIAITGRRFVAFSLGVAVTALCSAFSSGVVRSGGTIDRWLLIAVIGLYVAHVSGFILRAVVLDDARRRRGLAKSVIFWLVCGSALGTFLLIPDLLTLPYLLVVLAIAVLAAKLLGIAQEIITFGAVFLIDDKDPSAARSLDLLLTSRLLPALAGVPAGIAWGTYIYLADAGRIGDWSDLLTSVVPL